MKTKNEKESAFESLRKQAEKVVRQRGAKTSEGEDLQWLRLLNEIEVYQVELELQNQELNRSTKELEAARNDYFELYDSAPVAYVTLDGDGMIQRKNKAAARLVAESGNLKEGALFARAIHPSDQSAFFSYLNTNVTEKKQSSCEIRLRRKDDRQVWVQFMARSIFDMQREFRGWRLAIIDVTERKKHENEMRTAHKELEHRARQLSKLTVELTMAEQRERRRLAERMHDDLQQLLVGVRFNLEIAEAGIAADRRPHLKNAYDLLLQSIDASRNLSVELSPPVLFLQGLPEALAWLARWMKKTHALDVEIQADVDDCRLDEAIKILIFQSVRELLFNVKKHAETNFARVEMTRREGQLCIVVSDAGTGFDTRKLWQSDSESGIGFGLFSVRERLALLKGTFEIESSPDCGTTATVTVPMPTGVVTRLEPAKEEEDATREVSQSPDSIRTPRQESGNKIRVMLAEDHPVIKKWLSTMLAMHADIQVEGKASSGEQIVALARKIKPDVILMDINMPKMNGVEATRIIKSELPDIRIIGLSMHESGDQAAAIKQAGASAYLTKSCGFDILLAAIRKHGGEGRKLG